MKKEIEMKLSGIQIGDLIELDIRIETSNGYQSVFSKVNTIKKSKIVEAERKIDELEIFVDAPFVVKETRVGGGLPYIDVSYADDRNKITWGSANSFVAWYKKDGDNYILEYKKEIGE